jgi:hypothetical protein
MRKPCKACEARRAALKAAAAKIMTKIKPKGKK